MAAQPVLFSSPPKLDSFVLTERLGQGTYATVYKAYKKGNGRDVVAIKCIQKNSLTKSATENLLTEIELLKKLDHEYIVKLKDFQWDDRYIFLIMEYCSGGDLSRFIQAKRKLPEWIARKFLRQLASALCFLHAHNIAHMDLKPHNLLLSSPYDPVLKLADFGFAQYLYAESDSRNIRGSPLYMAPEMICHESYDASVDLWSVGVILYETLFGEAPFKSRTFSELEAKIRSSDPIQIPIASNVSSDCKELLLSLLQRDPKQRISFEAFFSHPFIDMEHMPSSLCLEKAADLVVQAVALDRDKEYMEAAKLYSQAMEYFLPALEYEKDPVKKAALRKRVNEYMSRAEDLKQVLKAKTQRVPGKDYTSTPDQLLAQFSRDNPELKDALHLAEIAEIRDEHGNYSGALQQYQKALHSLLPLLAAMPKGTYKDALRSEIDRYMRRAEELKFFLKLAGQQRAQVVEQQQDPSNQRLKNTLKPDPSIIRSTLESINIPREG